MTAAVAAVAARRKFDAHTKRLVAARAGWRCAACGELLDETYELDHVVSLHRGGEDAVENLQPLHASCHRKKTVREEAARLARRREERDAGARPRRAPLVCLRCERVVSPYFEHSCGPVK